MKTPGPDHPITTRTHPTRINARANGHVIATTVNSLELQEASYPPVQYLLREDVETGFLSRTEKVTHCPYKGDATHYSIFVNGELLENCAWSYEEPFPAVEAIRGRVAFYTDKVEVYPAD